jgi:hypothetical protein
VPFVARLPRWIIPAIVVASAASYVAPPHFNYCVAYYVFTRLNMIEYAWAWFMGYFLFSTRRIDVVLPFALIGSILIGSDHGRNPEPYAVVTFLISFVVVLIAASHYVLISP